MTAVDVAIGCGIGLVGAALTGPATVLLARDRNHITRYRTLIYLGAAITSVGIGYMVWRILA